MHFDTPIYQAAEQLRDAVFRAIPQMPKAVKPVLAGRLVDSTVTLAQLIRLAAIARDGDKVPIYNEALSELEALTFMLRGSVDQRFITAPAYASTMPLTESIGKQAIALRNRFAPAS